MQPIIRVEGLGKRYRIAHAASGVSPYRTLREDLARLVSSPLRRLRGISNGRREDFWALQDVSFEVQSGEVVGIIGRNGAGKSTLLKILSRITKPTTGLAELRGRVGSLLEVGTGFHPELTGRENIFLNGAILGMSRREVCANFDDIVAFAEVERFLDTPVKRYSSGMYVRLAFSVAAHLEPEVLVVDEVLAVGDIAFQRKCMGRMQEVGRTGRTVLFVSHNMSAIEALCTRAVLLENGQIAADGEIGTLVHEYRKRAMAVPTAGTSGLVSQEGSRPGRVLCSAQMFDTTGSPTNFIPLGGQFHLRIGLNVPDVIDYPFIGVGIDDMMGQRVLTVHTPLSREEVRRVAGRCAVDCRIPDLPLAPGEYWVKITIAARGAPVDSEDRTFHFTVLNGELFDTGLGFSRGVCIARSEWGLVCESQAIGV